MVFVVDEFAESSLGFAVLGIKDLLWFFKVFET
jgi:hypothetical protein